jgi:regulator of RNase E activity RraA
LPGDIVVGDEDGVVVVPSGDAMEVLERVRALESNEAKRITAIQGGALFLPEIDETLRAKGVIE